MARSLVTWILRRKLLFFFVFFLSLGAIGTAVFFYYSLSHRSDQPAASNITASGNMALEVEERLRAAPAFELPDFHGQMHHLEDFRGNVVLIHFWASWCPPCLEEIPQWIDLATSFKENRIRFIAISVDQTQADALKILPTQKLSRNMSSLWDSSGKVAERFGTFEYPETYLLTPNLKVIMKWVGPQNWTRTDLRELIQKLIPRSSTTGYAFNTRDAFLNEFRH